MEQVLKGQTAIVTGAGRGIGRAIAVALARAGADVAVNDHPRSEDAQGVVDEIKALGRRALLVKADVGDWASVDRMVEDTVAAFGHLDIAVTNAVYADRGPFHEVDLDGFARTIQVTMWGAFYAVRAAATRMIARDKGGSIVVISSPHAYLPIPHAMAYNMAKGAVDQMARTAAMELVDHRIRVNIVHPGWVDTPGERKFASDEQIARSAPKLPWKRLARPDEIARGVVFICDPESDYMTGSTLQIDGGGTLPWWAARGSGVPE